MTYLPFENYLIEQGWTPVDGCDKDLNVSYNPIHVFMKENKRVAILVRQQFINQANMGKPDFKMEVKEALFAVECKPEGMNTTMFIMPNDPDEFHLVLEGKLIPAQQILWPV